MTPCAPWFTTAPRSRRSSATRALPPPRFAMTAAPRCCAARPRSRKYCASRAKIDLGAFEYTALDAGGRERKGVLEGDTPRQIRQQLREQQLLPVSVTEVAQKE